MLFHLYLQLENKATRVFNDGSAENHHRTVLATQGFTQGRRYWEVTLESLADDGVAVYIGVCKI